MRAIYELGQAFFGATVNIPRPHIINGQDVYLSNAFQRFQPQLENRNFIRPGDPGSYVSIARSTVYHYRLLSQLHNNIWSAQPAYVHHYFRLAVNFDYMAFAADFLRDFCQYAPGASVGLARNNLRQQLAVCANTANASDDENQAFVPRKFLMKTSSELATLFFGWQKLPMIGCGYCHHI